jgi:hypothetical protein
MGSPTKVYLNVQDGIEELRRQLFATKGQERRKLLETINKLQSGEETGMLQISRKVNGEWDVVLIAANNDQAERLLAEFKVWGATELRKAQPGKYLHVVDPPVPE